MRVIPLASDCCAASRLAANQEAAIKTRAERDRKLYQDIEAIPARCFGGAVLPRSDIGVIDLKGGVWYSPLLCAHSYLCHSSAPIPSCLIPIPVSRTGRDNGSGTHQRLGKDFFSLFYLHVS